MGKLVSFWSPYPGHGKVTSSICGIIGGFTLQYPELSLAVSHVRNDPVTLLRKLDSHAFLWQEKSLLDGFGIAALKMYERQKVLSFDNIRRCGLPLYDKSVYFYPNVTRNGWNDSLTFQVLTKQLRKEFEIVLLDLGSGNKEDALQYMQESDYVVVVLPQDPYYADCFLQKEESHMNNINYGIILGGCFGNSRYRSAYYKRKYGKKVSDKFLGEILWNADFFDAMSVGKTRDFFLRNNVPVKKEENYEFIIQIKKTTERIQEKLLYL